MFKYKGSRNATLEVVRVSAMKPKQWRGEWRHSTYCVEKLGIEMTVSAPEFSMRFSFTALDFSERVVLVPLRSSES